MHEADKKENTMKNTEKEITIPAGSAELPAKLGVPEAAEKLVIFVQGPEAAASAPGTTSSPKHSAVGDLLPSSSIS
jgi:hypothetical protein